MNPKGAGRQVLWIDLLLGLCLVEKLTVAETDSDGRGHQGVRTDSLLPLGLTGEEDTCYRFGHCAYSQLSYFSKK